MSESERPRNALDAAAWIHAQGGGPENLTKILDQITALRGSLLALQLNEPSIPASLDSLRRLERDIGATLRHSEGITSAFEAEGWRLDPAKPGGGENIGRGHRQKSLLVGYVHYLCEEFDITSYGKDAQDQILALLPPIYRDRARVKEAIGNYLKPSQRKRKSPPKPPKSA